MDIEFDPDKDTVNRAKHEISLLRAVDLEILMVKRDTRFDYGEERYRAWGVLDGAFYCLAFATRHGRIRPISLRRAHDKEIKRHVDQETD